MASGRKLTKPQIHKEVSKMGIHPGVIPPTARNARRLAIKEAKKARRKGGA